MKSRYIKLKYLIMSVVIVVFLTTMISNLWSAYRMNTEILTENTLETNRVYAQKLATTADRYIEETFTTLQYSANYVANKMDDEKILSNEAERLRTQNKMFNSVIVANTDGLVLGVSPPSLDLQGVTLTTPGPLEAMDTREPMVSKPYEGTTGRLIIFISHPIFAGNGDYLGFIGGSIYITEDNVFHSLLGQHFYDDGSYVFVVDEDGRVIYHEDPSHLNDLVPENEVVKKVMQGESGAQAVTNTQGVEMLAGYSSIKMADWGVISQRPYEVAIAPAASLNKNLAMYALPFAMLALLIVLWMAAKIARPLQQMAALTERSMQTDTVDELNAVPSWYYETHSLKQTLMKTLSALHNQVSFFKTQSTTDPLTGLMNRRTMDEVLLRWTKEETSYAVILIDLDHFKSVNDTYGHGVGDDVLKHLARIMESHAPNESVCCRYGGEEFIMLLPNSSVEAVQLVGERLRIDLAETNSPCGRPVTMSGGIALAPLMGDTPATVIEMADTALYRAKQEGRNRIVIALHELQAQ